VPDYPRRWPHVLADRAHPMLTPSPRLLPQARAAEPGRHQAAPKFTSTCSDAFQAYNNFCKRLPCVEVSAVAGLRCIRRLWCHGCVAGQAIANVQSPRSNAAEPFSLSPSGDTPPDKRINAGGSPAKRDQRDSSGGEDSLARLSSPLRALKAMVSLILPKRSPAQYRATDESASAGGIAEPAPRSRSPHSSPRALPPSRASAARSARRLLYPSAGERSSSSRPSRPFLLAEGGESGVRAHVAHWRVAARGHGVRPNVHNEK